MAQMLYKGYKHDTRVVVHFTSFLVGQVGHKVCARAGGLRCPVVYTWMWSKWGRWKRLDRGLDSP